MWLKADMILMHSPDWSPKIYKLILSYISHSHYNNIFHMFIRAELHVHKIAQTSCPFSLTLTTNTPHQMSPSQIER